MKSGIINVYKEKGYTSFDVVAKLRGILHIRKIGHTGTLDPDATGVLPVCVGKATKVCDLLTNHDKVYTATLLLGQETDTYDTSGGVVKTADVNVTEDEVRDVINSFVGDSLQVPPMYSALKVNGKKLYELAREGKVIERKPRPITIYNIEVIDINLPYVKMEVHCSKGTYIRSLCHDIGEKLGCFGTMSELVRNKVSTFTLDNAHTLSEIEELVRNDNLENVFLPIDSVFYDYQKMYIKDEAEFKALNGGKLAPSEIELEKDSLSCSCDKYQQLYRAYLQDGSFVGLYRCFEDYYKIEKMFYENI